MSEEAAFLAALRENPADDTTRLVYADWLDERGDSRADYLRLLATATAEDFDAYRLVFSGEALDAAWREAVAARFELVYHGAGNWTQNVMFSDTHYPSGNWDLCVSGVLVNRFRCDRVALACVREGIPAVLFDRLTIVAASQTASEWRDEAFRSFSPTFLLTNRSIEQQDDQPARPGGTNPSWIRVRAMGAVAVPVPTRFVVVVSGQPNNSWERTAQVGNLFAEPLRALFGMTDDDARYVLDSSGSVALRAGLSFADALAETATFNNLLKKHAIAKSLRELVSIEIRPEPPI